MSSKIQFVYRSIDCDKYFIFLFFREKLFADLMKKLCSISWTLVVFYAKS